MGVSQEREQNLAEKLFRMSRATEPEGLNYNGFYSLREDVQREAGRREVPLKKVEFILRQASPDL